MNLFKNLWFILRARRFPRLTDTKTQKLIDRHNQLDTKLVAELSPQKLPRMKQLKYLSKILTPRDRLVLRICNLLIIAGLFFIGFNTYFINTSVIPAIGGEYSEALVGTPQYVNPILSSTNNVDMDLTAIIYNGLLRYDDEKGLIPDLAESYTVSDDQKVYTFVLRKNVSWHDGEPFTADDVVATINRIKEPESRSPLFYNFKSATIEKIDDTTIRFILEQPFAPFTESLTVGIMPNHIWSRIPTGNTHLSEFNLKPIGTGPYKFDSLVKDNFSGEIKSYSLIRNDKYFVTAPFIKKLTFKFYPNSDQAIDALNNRNVMGLNYLPKDKTASLINSRSLNFHNLQQPQYTALFFNVKNNSLLADSKIRKLLSHGINKDQLVIDVLQNQAQKIEGPILPGQLGFTNDFPKYPYDPDYAKAELGKLGWKMTDYKTEAIENKTEEPYPFQVLKKNTTYFEVDLTTINLPENVKIAEQIQKNWQNLGIKAAIKLANPDTFQKDILNTRDYEVLLYGEVSGIDPDPYPFWHSSQISAPGLNLSLFANAKADDLLTKARQTTESEKRANYYVEFQKIMATEMPAIFLFNPTYTYAQTKDLKGFNLKNIFQPSHRLADIAEWFLKSARQAQ